MGAAVSIPQIISLVQSITAAIQIVMKNGPQFIEAIRRDRKPAIEGGNSNSSRQQDQQQIQMLVQQLRQYENKVDDLVKNQAELRKTIETLMCLNNKITNSVDSNVGDNATTTYRVEIEDSQNLGDNNEIMRNFWKSLSEIEDKSASFKITDDDCHKLESEHQLSDHDSLVENGSTERLSQALAGIIECNICTEHYNSSNRLPCVLSTCGHTFCKQCIVRMSRRIRDHEGTEFEWYYDSLRCPECRIESELDLEHLTPNDWLLQVVDNELQDNKIKNFKTEEQNGDESFDKFTGATASFPTLKSTTMDYEDDDDDDIKSLKLIQKLQEESTFKSMRDNDEYNDDIESMKLIQKLQEEEKSMEYALLLDKEEKLKHREIREKEQMELALAISLSEAESNSTS